MTQNSLQDVLDNLNLSSKECLFLTIKTVYLYEMKAGTKNVEYRSPGDFIFSRLYTNFKKNRFSTPKKIPFVLFQAGYNPDSPRMLIELKGWNNQGENHPEELETTDHEVDRWSVNLLLGKILYENLDMSREDEYRKKEMRFYEKPQLSKNEVSKLKLLRTSQRSRKRK